MNPWHAFFWGFGGSLAADVIRFHKASSSGRESLPAIYSQASYYVGVLLVAVLGGGLAVAGHPGAEWAAIQIGVSTPLIVEKLGRKGPPTITGGK